MISLKTTLVFIGISLTAGWPCPEPADIAPCVCTENDSEFSMDMECSNVTSSDELERIFQADMPFHHYEHLYIVPTKTASLTVLTSRTFGVASFNYIYIRNAGVEVIEDGTFAYSERNLTVLDLRNNRIDDFPFESLSNYHYLETLLLRSNRLWKVLDIESSSLKTLDVSINPGLDLTTGYFCKNCSALQVFNASKCNMQYMAAFIFDQLDKIHTIDLSNNNFTFLVPHTITPPNPTVTSLILDGCPITDIEVNAIGGFAPSAKISMSNTQMTHLYQSVWTPIVTLLEHQAIQFTGNPLRCGCEIEWMYQNSTSYYKTFTSTSDCSDGYRIYDIPPEVFDVHC